MKGDPLPETDHMLRYVGGGNIQGDVINGAGFLVKHPNEPSVNWLEVFPLPLENQIAEVRIRRRIDYGAKGRLVRLNVGQLKAHILANAPDGLTGINCLHDPLAATDNFLADDSHSVISGTPSVDTPEGELVGDLIVECIVDHFPAREPT